MVSRPLLLACLWLAALPALGERFEFVQPVTGSTLTAGDEVAVRWAGAPAAVREMELLLSVDGGRRFAVRLTRELAGDASTYLWRVPQLPSGAARLALRVNLDGREVEVGTSAPFAIAAGVETAGPAGSIELIRGELWWTERAVPGSEGEHLALAGLDAPLPEPRVLPAAGESMLADLRSPAFAPRPAALSTYVPRMPAASGQPLSTRPEARALLLSPLRI
ncbi:MAG: hypothetical protein ABJC13_08310 [Acidobacteriota bacterium]